MKKIKLSENFSLDEANFITNAISGPGHIFANFFVRAYRDGKELVGAASSNKTPKVFTDFGAAKKYAKAVSTNIDGTVKVKSGDTYKKPEYEDLHLKIGGQDPFKHDIISYSSGRENPNSDYTELFTDAFRKAKKAKGIADKSGGDDTGAEKSETVQRTSDDAPAPEAAEPAMEKEAPKTDNSYGDTGGSSDLDKAEDPNNASDDPADATYNTNWTGEGGLPNPTKVDPEEPKKGEEEKDPEDEPEKPKPPKGTKGNKGSASDAPAGTGTTYNGCTIYQIQNRDGSIIFNSEEQVASAVNGKNNKVANTTQKATQNITDKSSVPSKAGTGKKQTGKKPHRITPEEYAAMTPEQRAKYDAYKEKDRARHAAARAAKKTAQSATPSGITQTANINLTESYSEDYDMTFEELNDDLDRYLCTPGVYGVEIVGEDCTLFPTEAEAREYFDSLSLDDLSPDCEGILLFVVTDTNGNTDILDNKSVYDTDDDLTDEEFLEAFGAALKDKHDYDQECTNCSGANFNDDAAKFGDFKPGDEFSAFDDFDTEIQSDEIAPDEWDELLDKEDDVLTEEFEDNAAVPCKNYKVVAHCDDEKPVCDVKKPLEEPLADKADFTKDLYEEATSATKVDTDNLGAFDKAKEGPLWKVCDVLNTKGKVVIKNRDQLQKFVNYVPIYQKTAADGTRLGTPKNSGKLFNSDGTIKQIKADPAEDGKYSVTLTEAFGKKKTYYRVVGQEMGTSNPGKKVYLTNESESAAKETFSTICKKVHANPNTYINKGNAYCVKLLQADNEEFGNAKEVNSECVNSLREDHSRVQNAVKPLHYDASELGKNLPLYSADKEGILWDNCSFLESDGSTIVAYPEQAEAVIDYIPVYLVTDSTGKRYCGLKKKAPKKSSLVDAEGNVHRDWFDVKELGYKEYEITLNSKK